LNETNFTDISHITDESNNVNIPLVKKTIYSKQKYVAKKDSSSKKMESPVNKNVYGSVVTVGQIGK
jgi:hypothetical protein